MLPILLACALWVPATIGLGWPLCSLVGGPIDDRALRRLALCGMYGLLDLEMAGTAASFFTGTYPFCSTIAAAVGLTLFAMRVGRLSRGITRRQMSGLLGLAALAIVAAARGRLGYDIGLYHLQAIKWLTSGPTPLGLANLYGRLGFNDGWAPVAAMMETPFLHGKSVYFVNLVFMLLIAMCIVDAAVNLSRGFDRTSALMACGIYPWALCGFKEDGISYNPDFVVLLLVLVVCSLWLEGSDEKANAADAALLALLALTVKLSAMPLLAGAVAVVIFRCNARQRWIVAAICMTTIVFWMGRGVVLSGCLLYPSTIGRLGQLQWAVPEARVRFEAQLVRTWSLYHTMPGTEAHTGPALVWRMLAMQPVIVAVALLGLGMLLLAVGVRRRRQPPLSGSWWIPAIVSAGGIAFWLSTAPSLRFGYGYIFCLAVIMFCAGIEAAELAVPARSRAIAIVSVLIALLALSDYYRKLNHVTLWRWPDMPTSALRTQQTADGITLFRPTPPEDRVWDAPLPATPYPDPALRYSAAGRFERFWLDPSGPPMLAP